MRGSNLEGTCQHLHEGLNLSNSTSLLHLSNISDPDHHFDEAKMTILVFTNHQTHLTNIARAPQDAQSVICQAPARLECYKLPEARCFELRRIQQLHFCRYCSRRTRTDQPFNQRKGHKDYNCIMNWFSNANSEANDGHGQVQQESIRASVSLTVRDAWPVITFL